MFESRAAPVGPVPVLRPKLPPAERIAPWLKRIDETRWYSNFGPLEELFRTQLGDMAGLTADQIGLFSSGTAALAVGLRAMVGKAGGLCLMPSWTHVGTPCAARTAGLEPWFLDCDPKTWEIDPAAALKRVKTGDIAAVVPVAPFGSRIDYEAWDRFSRETGVPVLIDAAAGFDQFVQSGKHIAFGRTPVMISLHATKVMGVGEGGALFSADRELVQRAQQLGNFGIWGDQPIDDAFGNLKLNEYAAAVGLAGLELWPERRRELAALASRMAAGLDRLGLPRAPGFAGEFVSSTCMVEVPGWSADQLERFCEEHEIGARRWWRAGSHTLASFADCGREPLTHTEGVAGAFLGVGYYPGMTEAECDRVLEVLAQAAANVRSGAAPSRAVINSAP